MAENSQNRLDWRVFLSAACRREWPMRYAATPILQLPNASAGEALRGIPFESSRWRRRIGMSNSVKGLAVCLVASIAAGSVRAVFAMGGGGPPVSSMTQNYCRETVANKGITDVTRFEAEVRKCVANPVTYPPEYRRPGGL
jgi:hypothetical protein